MMKIFTPLVENSQDKAILLDSLGIKRSGSNVINLSPLGRAAGFISKGFNSYLMVLALMLSSFGFQSFAQNAPIGEDKYYLLLGELLWDGQGNTSRTDVYQFTTGGGISNCSLPGVGGGEGMAIDHSQNIAYIATCCAQGEVRIYDYNTASFLNPIKLPAGEDILDVALSLDNAFLYVATYKYLYKISTSSRTIVGSFAKGSLSNPDGNNFWGVAVHPTNGNIYVSTNWRANSGKSTIEAINPNMASKTLIATAPTGFNYRGVTFASDGSFWVVAVNGSGSIKDKLFHYSSTGSLISSFEFPTPSVNAGNGAGKVDPYDIAFGPDGNLYITTFDGDCVTKFKTSNNTFSTYLQYVSGVGGKSIAFVGGNFKCVCSSPVVNQSNITLTSATCSGSVTNENATAKIGNLVYSSSKAVKADIKEGSSYGTTPIYGAGSNKILSSGQTSITFNSLKQGTTYTVRLWSGYDACFTDVTFTTGKVCCATISSPDPQTAQVNKGQVFDLTVNSNATTSTYIEWVRSTQNVSSLDQLTTKTVVGGGYVTNGAVTIQVNAPSSDGTYYYYACFKPLDACGTFAKHIVTVKNIGTEDPVCFSGTRVITDNKKNGACEPSSSTYYSVWLNMKSSNGKPNYQHFKSSDLKFEEYCNGTAKLYGRALADGGSSNDYIDVVYNLSNRTATTPSNSPKTTSCSTYGNDLYYYKDAVGTIKGGASGIYQGMEITISDIDSNSLPAFQLGTGANINTNDFGASGWFDMNFTSSGTNGWSKVTSHGDFNFNLGGIVPFELEASTSSQSVCLDGSVTFNAQFKGEVPEDCNLSYSWKSPNNVQVSTTQSFSINNVLQDNAGVYTVTASFVSGGQVCSATATVNIVVDPNCEGTPVCVPDCTPVSLVSWDLDNCNTGTGGNWYGEFTPNVKTGGCGEVEASTIYRVNPDVNKHSCASGISGDAMCINGIDSNTKPNSGNDRAVRFATTITPSSGKSYKLSDLQFSYKRSGYQCNDGGSQSLVLYVFKNGTKVYEETITGLTKSWKTKTVTFSESEDFISDAATTYEFELIGFNPVGGCTVWEIDEVKLNGCCGNSVAKPVINVSSGNICKGESVTLTASNCSGDLLWSTGATTAEIVVSPQITTSYLVSCSLGSCSAQQSVTVTVDPNCNNDVCLTCQPKTVVKWNLDQCLALTEAYSYSEFLPEYPNSGNFTSVSATNIYRNNPNDNPHSCVVGFTGNANSDRAMCVSANKSSSADWDKAIRFKATFNPSQTGSLTKLRFNQRAASILNYAPEPSSSGGSASNNYPTKYSLRIYKDGSLVYESLNRSTSPTNWTTEEIDLSSDPDFEFSDETEYEFKMTAYSPVGNGASISAWDLDNIEIIACNKSDLITATASNNGNICIGGDVTLSANSGTSNLTYNWTGPNGFTATGSSVTTAEPGVYTVSVTSTNSCTATATTQVTFKDQPKITVSNTTTCAGEAGSLTASACNGNVSWNTGATGKTLTINNTDVTKEYTATCTENGCTASASGIIYVQNCNEDCIPPTDDEFEICEDEVLTEDVTSNDVLPSDAFDIVYSVNSNVSNGTLNFSNNGEFVYTPTPGFSGVDNFIYKQVYKINDSIQSYTTDDAVLNGCGTNKIIDTYVKGLENGGQSNTISVPNPSNLNNVIVEVWVENGSCSNTMTIEGQVVTGQFVVRTNGQPDSEKIFRTTLSSISADGVINISAGSSSCKMSSVAAYVERDQIGGASSYLSSDTDLYHGYVSGGDDCVTVNIPIGGSSSARDIDFKIPLHEVDNVRPVTVTITAGGVTQSVSSTSGTNGADLVSITLSNVPASAEIAEITVCSPDGNGDSFGIGAVSAAVEECKPPSEICEEVAEVEIIVHPRPKGSIPVIESICQTFDLELKSGVWTNANSYSWVGPNGFSSDLQNPTITAATPDASGTYTLTVSNLNGCVTTATVVVEVGVCEYDLALVKTREGAATVNPNDEVTFNITVKNQGEIPSGLYEIKDRIPLGTELVSAPGNTNVSGRLVTWSNLPNLAPGQTATYPITIKIVDPSKRKFRNWAEITNDSSVDYGTTDDDSTPDSNIGDDDDLGTGVVPNDNVVNNNDINADSIPNDEDDNDYEDVDVDVRYDLSLVKNRTSDAVASPANPNVTYDIIIKNDGDVESFAYAVTDLIPGGISVTINALDDASFSFGSASYCVNASDPTPTIIGVAGGTFSSTVGLSINSATGQIDVSASTPGNYSVTYTTAGTCSNSSNVSVTINALDDASFSFGSASYCVNASDPTPTITGVAGGTFSSTVGLSINSATGQIDVSASTSGAYSVTYSTAGTCSNSSTASVTITALDNSSFNYSASAYCIDASDPTPTITGVAGGTFSSTAGLSINASTGQIDVSASTPGAYSVTYTTAGTCPNSSSVSVTINALGDASFSYGSASYCVSAADPTPTITGVASGTFSSTVGLSINSATGQIDVSASTPGNYSVTYTTAGTCPNSSNASVTINALDDASFNYSASAYCVDGLDPTPTITGLSGGVFSSTAGLSINTSTGAIDVSASTPGTYSVTYTTAGTCSNSSNVSVTINALDDASFSYGSASYCVSTSDPTPTITGVLGGTFSSTAGLSINSATGQIDVSASTPGAYSVTYTTAGACSNSSTASVTITALDDASFNYSASAYCVDASDPTPTITGVAGGTFSSTAGLSINASTGQIDVSASTPGAYSVTYTSAGTCPNSSNVSVTINALDDASFSYGSASYCVSAADPTPTITGVASGTFSSTVGLSINSATGQIDVSASTPGTYSVTYTTAGTCPNSSNASVTINALDDASFNYSESAYCVDGSDPTPTITGLSGGSFSSTGGLSINSGTGAIDVSASIPGTYTVTYTTAGTCSNSSTASVTINTLPVPLIVGSVNLSCGVTSVSRMASGGTSYSWSNSLGTNAIANITAPGTYTVTVTGSNGCLATATTAVTIDNAVPSVSITGTDSLNCTQNSVTRTALGTGTYQWSNGLGTNTTANITVAGTYTVTLTAANGCTNTATTAVFFDNDLIVTASNDGPYEEGDAINFMGTGGPSYLWTGPDGFTSSSINPSISKASPAKAGIYTVTVNTGVCTGTATTNVIISCSTPGMSYYVAYTDGAEPEVFSPLVSQMEIQVSNRPMTVLAVPNCELPLVESARLQLSGTGNTQFYIDNDLPYSLYEQNGAISGDVFVPNLYTFISRGFSQDNSQGIVVVGPDNIQFSIVHGDRDISYPTLSTNVICAGTNLTVSSIESGVFNFNVGNVFQAYLSDENGNFGSQTLIGSSLDPANIVCSIPNNLPSGNNYKVVIRSSSPIVSSAVSASLSITSSSVSLLSPTNDILSGTRTEQATQTINAQNKIEGSSNVMYKAGNAVLLEPGFRAASGTVFSAKIENVCAD
ncbi:3-coathanger stack domain-containing protein [Arcticibacterium luteifluviistationis]|uniref:PKD domain-containing protein n=1 Tax=Arcticibacterium luteifluviistationis TaxID=1784714 RepID=A0A2Z4GDK2_9BACT|nr:3-coathanger stack domain-containing protein [Arcticibacterium luteifluviistationis]AWV99231.1 hypothetical protein DJ013_14070 [Arcticibacterium luteifluviistationis]